MELWTESYPISNVPLKLFLNKKDNIKKKKAKVKEFQKGGSYTSPLYLEKILIQLIVLKKQKWEKMNWQIIKK